MCFRAGYTAFFVRQGGRADESMVKDDVVSFAVIDGVYYMPAEKAGREELQTETGDNTNLLLWSNMLSGAGDVFCF